MGKFIITEEEKKRIKGLYEHTTSGTTQTTPEQIADGMKQLLINSRFEDRYKTKDTYTKTSSTGEEFIFTFPNPSYPIKNYKVKFQVKKPSQETIDKFRLKQNKSYPDYYMDDETSIKGGWEYWSPIFKDSGLENSPTYKQIKYYISNIK